MYGKVFSINEPVSLRKQVGWAAALVYAGLIHHAEANGEGVLPRAALCVAFDINLKKLDFYLRKLEAAGLIRLFKRSVVIAELPGGGEIYGSCPYFAIERFTPPALFERVTQDAWEKIRAVVFERDDYTCAYCGKRGGSLECDHVIPLAGGGTNEIGNLTTACRECNRSKRAKAITEWKAKQEAA